MFRTCGKIAAVVGILALAVISLFGNRSAQAAPLTRFSALGFTGAVYTETNSASGNAVVAFARATDGTLAYLGTYPTGGTGIGGTIDPLQSQYALILNQNGSLLFVVDAGSNDVATFRVQADGRLSLLGRIASNGQRPASLADFGDLLYVLNNGGTVNNNQGTGNISGFRIQSDGALTALSDSSRLLSGSDVGGSTIAFSRDGHYLAVTERAANKLDLYPVLHDGRTAGPLTSASHGLTPFGFGFANNDVLVTSEAEGGAPNGATVSSYHATATGLVVKSGSVPTNGTAACWLIVTPDSRFAYTTNAGSGAISGFRVASSGTLTALNATGFTGIVGPGSAPIDLAASHNSQYLYTLNAGAGTISVFHINADGQLSAVTAVSGITAAGGFQGLAAW